MSTRTITYLDTKQAERKLTVKTGDPDVAFPILVLFDGDGGAEFGLSKELAGVFADALLAAIEEVPATHKIVGYAGEVVEDDVTFEHNPHAGADCLCDDCEDATS
jgi:hypothetical protein